MEIFNIENLNKLLPTDIQSIANVLEAYSDHNKESIECAGFNIETWTAYITLSNRIEIISTLWKPVKFLVYNEDNDKEIEFSDYHKAEQYVKKGITK